MAPSTHLLKACLVGIAITCCSIAAANNLAVKDFNALASKCAPSVSLDTLATLAKSESSFNPYRVIVDEDNTSTPYDPANFIEAMTLIASLEENHKDYRLGLTGINKKLTQQYGVKMEQLLDGCTNLAVASVMLGQCFSKTTHDVSDQERVTQTLACFSLENGKTGYALGYAQKLTGVTPPPVPSFAPPPQPLMQLPKDRKAFVF